MEAAAREDACQALGRDWEEHRGRGKYERHGGPSFVEIARLLDEYSSSGIEQLRRLLSVATFTVAIGNADAHGKNLSLVHREQSGAPGAWPD
jgi:serine/threonine-protein kinase HipA